MSKPFHAGKAAMDGLTACLLAYKGLDSSSDIFNGEQGFFDLFTADPDCDAATNGLGKEFLLSEICFKTYPAPL
jgi:2-methylcitrate dehydratase PrpD